MERTGTSRSFARATCSLAPQKRRYRLNECCWLERFRHVHFVARRERTRPVIIVGMGTDDNRRDAAHRVRLAANLNPKLVANAALASEELPPYSPRPIVSLRGS